MCVILPLVYGRETTLLFPNAQLMSNNEASELQKALAAALERALGSASLLLREALVGRIRAHEVEQKVRYRHAKNIVYPVEACLCRLRTA